MRRGRLAPRCDPNRAEPYASHVETIESDRRVAPSRGSIGWWYGGIVVDLVHMPIVLALVALGASKWNGPVYVGVITVIVILQVAMLGCPVFAVSGWMKRKYDPEGLFFVHHGVGSDEWSADGFERLA